MPTPTEPPMLMNYNNYNNDPRFSAPVMREFLEKACFRYVEKPEWPKKKILIKRALNLKITCKKANEWLEDGKPIQRFGPGGENEEDDEKVGKGEGVENGGGDEGDDE